MTLWRLEWARLVRTRRLVALLAVYLFFGALGPLTVRYLQQIVNRFGNGVEVVVPPPKPADGIAQYMANGQQLGLLVTVLVLSAALAFDAQRENAVFLRSRVRRVADVVLPRMWVNLAAAAAAFALGAALAWYETAFLIGPLPAGRMLAGIALVVLYLAFVVSVVALMSSFAWTVVGTAIGSLVVVIGLGIVGAIDPVGTWLPSHLVGSLDQLASGGTFTNRIPSVLVTLAAIPAMTAWALHRLVRRDI